MSGDLEASGENVFAFRKEPRKEMALSSRSCNVWTWCSELMPPCCHQHEKEDRGHGRTERWRGRTPKCHCWMGDSTGFGSTLPLEFLICEIINSLLFKPAWVRVLFLPPKASWLIQDLERTLLPLLPHPVAELNATENYQQPIPEAAQKRKDLGQGVTEHRGIQDHGSRATGNLTS